MKERLNNRYELRKPLGQGTSGVTYLAFDHQSQQLVAIKQFHVAMEAAKSWKRETDLLRKLSHPQLPDYIDFFTSSVMMVKRPHLVQEYIEGCSLAEEMKNRSYTIQDILEIAAQLLSIIAYLQSLSPPILHRDIKPSNILRRKIDQKLCLIDFGAAISMVHRTLGHTIAVGTLGYQAPEQIRGEPTPASDLYSLGAVMLQLLLGISPSSLLVGQSLHWEEKSEHLPKQLKSWLSRMLSPASDNRFQSAATALAALQKLIPQIDQLEIPQPSFSAASVRTHIGKSPQSMKRRLLKLELAASEPQDWLDLAQGWQELGQQENVEECLQNLQRSCEGTALSSQSEWLRNAARAVGKRTALLNWLTQLEEAANQAADFQELATLWIIFQDENKAAEFEQKGQDWLAVRYDKCTKALEKNYLIPDPPKPPLSVEGLEEWRTLTSRWIGYAQKVVLPDADFSERITLLKKLSRTLQIQPLATKLEDFVDSSDDLQKLAGFWAEIGDRKLKERYLQKREEWLQRIVRSLQKKLLRIKVKLNKPRSPLTEQSVEKFSQRVNQQLERAQQAVLLDRKSRTFLLKPVVWTKPFDDEQLEKRKVEISRQEGRRDKLKHLQEQAKRIQWQLRLPDPPYHAELVQELQAEIEEQTKLYEQCKDDSQRVTAVIGWVPKSPNPPFAKSDIALFRATIEEQIELHQQLQKLWLPLHDSGKKLVSLPKPPYKREDVERFKQRIRPLYNTEFAQKKLLMRRLQWLGIALLGMLIPLSLWQISLSSRTETVLMTAKTQGITVPFPDPTCSAESYSTKKCAVVQAPSFPYTPRKIEFFEMQLGRAIVLKNEVSHLHEKAKELGVDDWDGPYLQPELDKWKKNINVKENEADEMESLKLRAIALGFSVKHWKAPYSAQQVRQWKLMVENSEQQRPLVIGLRKRAQLLGVKHKKIPLPYQSKDIKDWQSKLDRVHKVRELFQQEKQAVIPAGRFIVDKSIVQISRPYQMLVTETEQGLYEAVMGENPSFFRGDGYPVENVSWLDAVTFANQLSWSLGLEECYQFPTADRVQWQHGKSCKGWRLPTEGEWIYASRGQKNILTLEQLKQGFDLDAVEPKETDLIEKIPQQYFAVQPITSAQANGFGVYAMDSNLMEWVWSTADPMPYGFFVDNGIGTGKSRVIRGNKQRFYGGHKYKSQRLGFRLVRTGDPIVEYPILAVPSQELRQAGQTKPKQDTFSQ